MHIALVIFSLFVVAILLIGYTAAIVTQTKFTFWTDPASNGWKSQLGSLVGLGSLVVNVLLIVGVL